MLNRNFSYADVHVDAARLIAKISRECNVQKLIHFSSLNASLNPQTIYFKPSQYLITKVKLTKKEKSLTLAYFICQPGEFINLFIILYS